VRIAFLTARPPHPPDSVGRIRWELEEQQLHVEGCKSSDATVHHLASEYLRSSGVVSVVCSQLTRSRIFGPWTDGSAGPLNALLDRERSEDTGRPM
jgi:hypothetical protein